MDKYNGVEIAIIGMSARFPGAGDVNQYWRNLCEGKESISFFNDNELMEEGVSKNILNNPLYVRANAFLDNKEYFDSNFFGYLPVEAKLLDPQARIFHEECWKALEDAGYGVRNSEEKVGLFAGGSSNPNWQNYAIISNLESSVDAYTASHLRDITFLCSRISYLLNLQGPSVYIATACSTSLVAVQRACMSLLLQECNLALAGGVAVNNFSKKGYVHQEGMIYSRDGHCRPFDANCSGTVGGEGTGVVVLKRLKDAMRDNDHIYAVIKGGAINNDGNQKVSFTAPSVNGQYRAILKAINMAKVEPESITYVEAHGTATELGDPIEVEALNLAFGKSKQQYCALGSVKSNMGHLDAAAGIASLIKVALALKHKQIPPSLHFSIPNPKIDFNDSPFYVNKELKKWHSDKYPLRAGVSSFGIGGTNAHVILEQAPEKVPTSSSRDYQLLMFSAKTPAALTRNIQNVRKYLKEDCTDNLPDVAYTLHVGRAAFAYREFIVCKNNEEAINLLSADNLVQKGEFVSDKIRGSIVFMFSGQGAQYAKMGYGLYQSEVIFRDHVDRCLEIIKRISGKDIKPILFDDTDDSHPINRTEFTQVAIFVIEYSMAQLLMAWNIKPDIMIGHSIGEYVSACLAGVFLLEDALTLVVKRGELMQKMDDGAMLSISISEHDLKSILDKHDELSLAAVNSTSLCVVAGKPDAIETLKKTMEAKGYSCKKINVTHAFHSYMMDGVLDEFRKVLTTIKMSLPQIPFISNLTGMQAAFSDISKPQYWLDHLRKTVLFSKGIETLLEKKNVVFVEVAPGKILSTFVRANEFRQKEHKIVNIMRDARENKNDLEYLLSAIGELWKNGIEPKWPVFYKNEIRKRASLPVYSFDRVKYPVNVDAFKMVSDMISVGPLAKDPDMSKWFYAPSWKLAAELNFPQPKSEECILFLADDAGLSSGLIEKFKDNKNIVICVTAANEYREISPTTYEIDPTSSNDYENLFLTLSHINLLPARIIHAWGVTKDIEKDFSKSSSELFFHSLIDVVKSCHLLAHICKQIVLITSDVHPILTNSPNLSSMKGLSLGFLKVISQEYPATCTMHIDIDLAEMNNRLLDVLYKEIYDETRGKFISMRHGKRWEQCYDKIQTAADTPHIAFKPRGVYFITGGLGAVGFAIAKKLLKLYEAKVILLGRTSLPPREVWGNSLENQSIKEKIKRLEALEGEQSGEVFYLSCDISNYAETSKAVAIAEDRCGPIDGVIHAAGIIAGESINPISELTRSDFETQFTSKIEGLTSLKKAFENRAVDFCLLTSSLSAVLGGIGFGAYGSANTFMDYYVKHHHENGRLNNWISVNLDGLDFDGKSADAINEDEIFEVINRVLSVKSLPNVVVSTVDLQKRLEKWVRVESTPTKMEIDADTSTTPKIEVSNGYVPARNEQEAMLVKIWEKILGIEMIGIEDNFFELGGHSLTAMKLALAIKSEMNIEIPIRTLFKLNTITLISNWIQINEDSDSDDVVMEDFEEIRL